LWRRDLTSAYAHCPEHRVELEVSTDRGFLSQHLQRIGLFPSQFLFCPTDEKMFDFKGGDFAVLRRRFLAAVEALNLKDAKIVSIDGYQIPISKANPATDDPDYWAKVQINDTKQGKQLVVYAGRRGDRDKVQMFLDLENDKISFDQNNIHPKDVFTRVVAEFRGGSKTTLESGDRKG
jgi:hypothetical protein